MNRIQPALPRSSKVLITVLCVWAIAAIGFYYQNAYNAERLRIREAVRGFYLQYFGVEPDPAGLAHWTRWAQDRWGLEKVESVGFIETKKREEAARAR